MLDLFIHTHVSGEYASNAYFVGLTGAHDMLVIDPGDDAQALEQAAITIGRKLTHIVITHGHFDHMLAAAPLKQIFGAKVCAHPLDAKYLSDARYSLVPARAMHKFTPIEPDILLDSDTFNACGIDFEVLHTPGHTPGGICLYARAAKTIFTGDTLFADGFGRTDFEEGDWPKMYKSLKTLFALDPDTRALSGHGAPAHIGDIRANFIKT